MGFPEIRMRRLRTSGTMRRLVRETSLSVDDLVYPLFVCPGENAKERFDCPIAAYNVSGEYMMLNTAAQAGLLDKEKTMIERFSTQLNGPVLTLLSPTLPGKLQGI